MNEAPLPVTPVAVTRVEGPFVTISYDTARWPFAKVMCTTLGIASFADLPVGVPGQGQEAALINRRLRQELAELPVDAPIRALYQDFARVAMGELFGPRISFTKNPVLRIQIGHSPSISAPHRDVDYTQRWDYVNVWLPAVDVSAERGLQIETSYGSGVMTSHEITYGQALIFDGGALEHFSPENTSALPRVSMDFRFAAEQPSPLIERILGAGPVGRPISKSQALSSPLVASARTS